MSLLASQIFLMKKSIQSTPSNFMVFSTFNFRTMHRGIKTFWKYVYSTSFIFQNSCKSCWLRSKRMCLAEQYYSICAFLLLFKRKYARLLCHTESNRWSRNQEVGVTSFLWWSVKIQRTTCSNCSSRLNSSCLLPTQYAPKSLQNIFYHVGLILIAMFMWRMYKHANWCRKNAFYLQ